MTERHTELMRLAAACEAVKGPDREIDDAINRVMGFPVSLGAMMHCDAQPHAYTASLDAAMSLMPKDLDWSMGRSVGFRAVAHLWKAGEVPGFRCLSETPALALCAAALRAMAAQEDSNHG